MEFGEGEEGEECLLCVDAYTELNVSAPLIKRLHRRDIPENGALPNMVSVSWEFAALWKQHGQIILLRRVTNARKTVVYSTLLFVQDFITRQVHLTAVCIVRAVAYAVQNITMKCRFVDKTTIGRKFDLARFTSK